MASNISDIIEFEHAKNKYKINRSEFRYSILIHDSKVETRLQNKLFSSREDSIQSQLSNHNKYENVSVEYYALRIFLKNQEQPLNIVEKSTQTKSIEQCKDILLKIEKLF